MESLSVRRRFVMSAILLVVLKAGRGCQIPDKMRGSWYHNRDGRMEITSQSITNKGYCNQTDGMRYIFHSESGMEHCWKCLYIDQEHSNVIQYKETMCRSKRETMSQLCAQMMGDAEFQTLFRAKATPEPCPVQGPFRFNYTDSKGFCYTHESTADACASNSRIKFQFQSCPDVRDSQTYIQEFECLGSWESRSRRIKYFIAKMNDPGSEESKKFRCFMYTSTSAGGKIAISMESSCRGMTTIDENDAPVTKITYEINPPPTPQCDQGFKSWLRHFHNDHSKVKMWESLSKEPEVTHLVERDYWVVRDSVTGQNLSVATCVHGEDYGKMQKYTVWKIDGCNRGYQCIEVHQRSRDVIEILEGKMTMNKEDACTPEFFSPDLSIFQTYLEKNSAEKECPVRGRYTIHGCTESEASVSFGCTEKHQLVVDLDCNVDKRETYNCHGHWILKGVDYLVLKEQTTGKKLCYVYKKHGKILSMTGYYRHSCNQGVLKELNARKMYNASVADAYCNPSTTASLSSGTASSTVYSIISLLVSVGVLSRWTVG